MIISIKSDKITFVSNVTLFEMSDIISKYYERKENIIMKIIKKMSITLVLFLSLFFNTSTIFAGNNLSTTFNANNDELTVTVKNNSDKELSDVEYNLNLPNEYTAKYEVNPDYSLSPQKETTFKVKVSKSGDNVSNNGEKGTKTFTSSKKSLDNTGLTSELTVGAIVVLFLLVGVLLYFKQRKAFIILLMAGLGTQLTPRYSLASEKIRQTENFKDNVSLLEKNISVSLDISYLIEGNQNNQSNKKVDFDSSINKNDLKENSNEGDKNSNNNENKSDNGITNNDNVPKEVVVAGYAYSGKTNTVLEEKELKVFDGDKEIATVKTDSEGYFFTHLIQEKTYTIKGEDFEVTVTAKNTGDYEHKDIVGKLTLGRELKDEHTYMKIKPSVVFLNEDIEYVIEGNTLKFNREINVKEGDKVVLAPSHILPTGKSVIITKIKKKNNIETTLEFNLIERLDDILDEFKYNQYISLSEMQYEPTENFKAISDDKSGNRGTEYVTEKYQGTFYPDKGISFSVVIEGGLNIESDWKVFGSKKFIVEPRLKVALSSDINIAKGAIDKELRLKPLIFVTYFGVKLETQLSLFVNAKGEAKIKLSTTNVINAKIGYDNGGIFDADLNNENNLDLFGSFSVHGGIRLKPDLSVLGLNVVKTKLSIGPKYYGTGAARINKNLFVNNPDERFSGEITGLSVLSEAEVKFLKYKGEKEFRFFNHKVSGNNKQTIENNKNNIKVSNDIYKNIIEKYKKAIKDRGTDDSRINMSAIDLSYTPVLYKLGEKRMTYGYYDINGDGQDELIIFGSQGIADIYTIDFNDGVSKLLPEKGAYGVSLHPQITKDNKVVITGTEGGNDVGFDKHIFDVYDFEKNSRSLRLLTSVEGIGKTFNRVYPNKEQMSLQDFINNYEKKYKQNIVDLSNINKTTLIDKDTDSSENIDHVGGYSNAQLALIGRVLVNAVTPTEGVALRGLTMRKNGNSYITGLGNAASDVMVERTVNGISVLTPKYSAVGEEKKFEEKARYSYDELSNIIGENTLDEINDLIKSLKEIGTYKAEEFEG